MLAQFQHLLILSPKYNVSNHRVYFFPSQLQVPQFLLPQLYRKTFVCCLLAIAPDAATAQRSNADNSGNER